MHDTSNAWKVMRRIMLGAVAAVLLMGTATWIGGQVDPDMQVSAAYRTVALTGNVWDRVAKCESGNRWNINTGNGYYGGLQFSASTWRAFGGRQFAKNANQASRAQQIIVAERVLKKQGWNAWPVCSRKMKVRGYKSKA